MVENLPANVGDTSLLPKMPRSNEAHVPQLLSLCSRASEPQLLSPGAIEPVLCNKKNHSHEKPLHYNQRKSPHSQQDTAQPIN